MVNVFRPVGEWTTPFVSPDGERARLNDTKEEADPMKLMVLEAVGEDGGGYNVVLEHADGKRETLIYFPAMVRDDIRFPPPIDLANMACILVAGFNPGASVYADFSWHMPMIGFSEPAGALICPDCGGVMVKTSIECADGSGWYRGWLCGCKSDRGETA